MKVLMVSKSAIVAAHHDRLQELVKLGVELTLIVPPRWGTQRLETRHAENYEIRVLPCWFTPYNHFHFYPVSIGPIEADLVHLEEEPWSLVTYQFMRQCVKARKPVIFNTWQNIQKRYPPPFNLFERYTFCHAQASIAGSQEILRIMRARGFNKPVLVSGYGVHPGIFSRREVQSLRQRLHIEKAFVVGYMGRILADKGIGELIRAFALLPTDSVLLLVGEGAFSEEGRLLAAQLGVGSRIRWIPQIPSLQVPEYMSLMDVLVLPSRTTPRWKEQFGRVLIEAMACQTPLVGSSSGEIPNVIGDAGLIYPEGDVAELAKQISFLCENPQHRTYLARKGRDRVLKNFTNQKVAQRTVDLYRQVLKKDVAADRELIGASQA